MSDNYLFVECSSNAKTGAIPITYSPATTCPDVCPFKGSGCYSESGPSGIHWKRLTKGLTGNSWNALMFAIRQLPLGTLWRHNVAGDLPGIGNAIDTTRLDELVLSNIGRRGFTYTHKPVTGDNYFAIRDANLRGFTVNLSANNLAHADELAKTGLPVCAVVAGEVPRLTPDGRPVVQCPATLSDKVTCKTCGLCQKRDRKSIVAFPVHGSSAKKAAIASTLFEA